MGKACVLVWYAGQTAKTKTCLKLTHGLESNALNQGKLNGHSRCHSKRSSHANACWLVASTCRPTKYNQNGLIYWVAIILDVNTDDNY